jgi:hypothetical protein
MPVPCMESIFSGKAEADPAAGTVRAYEKGPRGLGLRLSEACAVRFAEFERLHGDDLIPAVDGGDVLTLEGDRSKPDRPETATETTIWRRPVVGAGGNESQELILSMRKVSSGDDHTEIVLGDGGSALVWTWTSAGAAQCLETAIGLVEGGEVSELHSAFGHTSRIEREARRTPKPRQPKAE